MSGLLVIEISWHEGSVPRTETFGPWEPRDDRDHFGEITTFLAAWGEATGCKPDRVVISAVQEPAAWLEANRKAVT
jgi:hypothetical protein